MNITRLKRLSIPKIAIEAGKMTEVVRDVIKGVQTSKQDVYEQKKEEFKPIREEIQKAVKEVSELRKDVANQIIPYSEQVQRLALKGSSCEESKMIFNMNKGFTPDELTIIQNKDSPLTGDVFLQTLKEPNYANETSNKVGEINKDLGTTTKNNRKENKDQIAKYEKEIDVMRKYRKIIDILEEGTKRCKRVQKHCKWVGLFIIHSKYISVFDWLKAHA